MEGRFNFLEETKKGLQTLALEELAIDRDLKHLERKDGVIHLECFRAPKIEKAVFSSIVISSVSVAEESVLLWPDDTSDLPIFWSNLTRMQGMNVHIFDLIPTMDIVVWPGYGDTYLACLQDLKSHAVEILKEGIAEKNFDLTSVVARVLSPNRVLFKLTDECRAAYLHAATRR